MKKVIGIIGGILLIYAVYVGVEVYRFTKVSDMKPLVLITANVDGGKNTFKGLGINVEYTYKDGDLVGKKLFIFSKEIM